MQGTIKSDSTHMMSLELQTDVPLIYIYMGKPGVLAAGQEVSKTCNDLSLSKTKNVRIEFSSKTT